MEKDVSQHLLFKVPVMEPGAFCVQIVYSTVSLYSFPEPRNLICFLFVLFLRLFRWIFHSGTRNT